MTEPTRTAAPQSPQQIPPGHAQPLYAQPLFAQPLYAQPLYAQPLYARHHPHPHGVLPAVQSLLYVLVVAMFLMTFTVQPIRIPSASMEPTLLVGDFLLLDRQATVRGNEPLLPPSGIQRGDVVVFHDPVGDPAVHLVKRVIGLPGDRIHLRRGRVFVNDQPLPETYTRYTSSAPDSFRDDFPTLEAMDLRVDPQWWIRLRAILQTTGNAGEITVPPGNYFVLGDNRNDSEDSRYWGFVPRRNVVGIPLLVYFSWREPSPDPQSTDAQCCQKQPAATPPEAGQSTRNFARWNRTFHVVH